MTERTMPVLFIGHGSPMNAIEHNAWSDAWRLVGAALPRPRAVLCVSAHWETQGPQVTGSASPDTIHDFRGFPQSLFDARYPAPGDPELARRVAGLLGDGAAVDPGRGLDHGAWSVLVPMFPGTTPWPAAWARCATRACCCCAPATSCTTCATSTRA